LEKNQRLTLSLISVFVIWTEIVLNNFIWFDLIQYNLEKEEAGSSLDLMS